MPILLNQTFLAKILKHFYHIFSGWIKLGLVQKLEEYWDCLEHHYSTYEVPSLGPDSRVNGLRTRSENLADHLGLAASYWAFQKLRSQNKNQDMEPDSSSKFKSLAGLDMFSQDQIFFLSFAHVSLSYKFMWLTYWQPKVEHCNSFLRCGASTVTTNGWRMNSSLPHTLREFIGF